MITKITPDLVAYRIEDIVADPSKRDALISFVGLSPTSTLFAPLWALRYPIRDTGVELRLAFMQPSEEAFEQFRNSPAHDDALEVIYSYARIFGKRAAVNNITVGCHPHIASTCLAVGRTIAFRDKAAADERIEMFDCNTDNNGDVREALAKRNARFFRGRSRPIFRTNPAVLRTKSPIPAF